jgi:hypothetical protein
LAASWNFNRLNLFLLFFWNLILPNRICCLNITQINVLKYLRVRALNRRSFWFWILNLKHDEVIWILLLHTFLKELLGITTVNMSTILTKFKTFNNLWKRKKLFQFASRTFHLMQFIWSERWQNVKRRLKLCLLILFKLIDDLLL